jgi:hypothetical protein
MRRITTLLFAGAMVVGCGGVGIPQISIPPIVLPSIPPIVLPSGLIPTPAAGSACALITAAEVGSILGSAVSEADDNSPLDCTFITGTTVLGVTTSQGGDLASIRFLFGESVQDINVGGLPGLSGAIMGLPAVYVQRGSDQLQITSVSFSGADPNFNAKLVQIATIAVSRWPA